MHSCASASSYPSHSLHQTPHVPVKKSELYSSLWKSCDELRGGMDASQYKDYVLVLLFVKYVSDKYNGQPHALIDVPAGGSFDDMVAVKGEKEIGDKINKIIARLAEANELRGVIDIADFNDSDRLGKGREMVDRLTNLISIFQNPGLDFSRNRAEGDDILGDAYEYLMRHFATESGKSKGQFYTPAEVSRVMAKIIGIREASLNQVLYDPTCGSGSLLLKAADEARNGVSIYGQEMDNATYALARMNMILHDAPSAEIWHDNTLSSPHFKETDGSLKLCDFIVANPPFSNKAWRNGFDPEHDIYGRFTDGVPPQKNGDFAFLLHILRSLKSRGKAAVIMPHGILFRGNVEGTIRRNLVRKGVIKGIIGLPANLFYGTGIPACIIVLDKENAATRTGIFMMDASKGFIKDGNKNRLRHQDIHKIVDVFTRQLEIEKYSRMVPVAEIEANDYNLNIPRYIDSTEPEDLHDIEAHLRGGIPDRDIEGLGSYWQVFPTLRHDLFESTSRTGYSRLKIESTQIRPTISLHSEFTAFRASVSRAFDEWRARNIARLKSIAPGDHPKELIDALSEDLLSAFAAVPLVDAYDVYQHLMDYWASTMQDDVYALASDGWEAASAVGEADRKEKPEFTVGKQKLKGVLIPAHLIVERFFFEKQQALDTLEEKVGSLTAQLEEMAEEHGGEDGLLEEVVNDKGKIMKARVAARLKEIGRDPEYADERTQLERYRSLIVEEAEASTQLKEARTMLDHAIAAKYKAFGEEEAKSILVEEKWLAALDAAVQGELDRISQALTGRIRLLAERYASPLPEIAAEVESLTRKVEAHLARMGFTFETMLNGKALEEVH